MKKIFFAFALVCAFFVVSCDNKVNHKTDIGDTDETQDDGDVADTSHDGDQSDSGDSGQNDPGDTMNDGDVTDTQTSDEDHGETSDNDTDGGALPFYKSLGSGLVLSTGVRVTLPLSNLL